MLEVSGIKQTFICCQRFLKNIQAKSSWPPQMLIFVSLPYEKDIVLDKELENIKTEYELDALRIEMPVFLGVSLENIIRYEEKLEIMDNCITDLCKRFIRLRGLHSIPYTTKALGWNDEKYNCTLIDESLILISEDIEKMKSNYLLKEAAHQKMSRDFEEAQRKTKGSLFEMDISVLIEEVKEYEFLEEIYILVDKEETDKFNTLVESTTCVSSEAIETITSDEKHVLYKALVVKNLEKEVKKIMLANNFIIKELKPKDGDKTNLEKINEFIENKNNLQLFISSNQEDAYSLLVHTKLLKLFIDSIYRYGLPVKYLYFVCREDKTTLKKLKTVVDNWESERMVGDDDFDGQEDLELNTANAAIRFDVDIL